MDQERDWLAFVRDSEAAGRCPYSGLTFDSCKGSDLCDCFDYPQEPAEAPRIRPTRR